MHSEYANILPNRISFDPLKLIISPEEFVPRSKILHTPVCNQYKTVQWSLQFKTPPLKIPSILGLTIQQHNCYIFNINIPPF